MKILLLALLCISVANCGTTGSFNSFNNIVDQATIVSNPATNPSSLISQAITRIINEIILPAVRQFVENFMALLPPAAQKSVANLAEDFKPLVKKLQTKENVGSVGTNKNNMGGNKNNMGGKKQKMNNVDDTITINGKVVSLADYGASNEEGYNLSGVQIVNDKVVSKGTLNGIPLKWDEDQVDPSKGLAINKGRKSTGIGNGKGGINIGNVYDSDGNLVSPDGNPSKPKRAARRV